jgi:hypothetical protein
MMIYTQVPAYRLQQLKNQTTHKVYCQLDVILEFGLARPHGCRHILSRIWIPPYCGNILLSCFPIPNERVRLFLVPFFNFLFYILSSLSLQTNDCQHFLVFCNNISMQLPRNLILQLLWTAMRGEGDRGFGADLWRIRAVELHYSQCYSTCGYCSRPGLWRRLGLEGRRERCSPTAGKREGFSF